MKIIAGITVAIAVFIIPSYLLGRWLVLKDFGAYPSMSQKQKITVVVLAGAGAAFMIYPASIVGTMIGMYSPLLLADRLPMLKSEYVYFPLSILTALLVFTAANILGVLVGKTIGKWVAGVYSERRRPNKAL
jgi:formate hydrogenlyase subunit 3/multisubunit Na+/H+ antiporter MnhD subunit